MMDDRAPDRPFRFSTLQRVEIAEMPQGASCLMLTANVSVLFNESKLLKS